MIDKKITFTPDLSLLYLIQQTTGQSSEQILGFFYDLGKEVLTVGLNKMSIKQNGIRKDIRDLYPNTAIPFKLLVKAKKWREVVRFPTISVEFFVNQSYIDTATLLDLIVENQLLGGVSIPNFEQPKTRTPKLYKSLIERALKGRSE